jgi:hypothetical protein
MSTKSKDYDETDDETDDPDVKKEFFKEHFYFVDRFNSSKKLIKKNNFTKNKDDHIYLVTTSNKTFYFYKKIDALYYIQSTFNCIYDKLYEKHKGSKDIFIVEDNHNTESNTMIYTRDKNYLFSYDILEYKVTFIELKNSNKNYK